MDWWIGDTYCRPSGVCDSFPIIFILMFSACSCYLHLVVSLLLFQSYIPFHISLASFFGYFLIIHNVTPSFLVHQYIHPWPFRIQTQKWILHEFSTAFSFSYYAFGLQASVILSHLKFVYTGISYYSWIASFFFASAFHSLNTYAFYSVVCVLCSNCLCFSIIHHIWNAGQRCFVCLSFETLCL